MNNFLKGWENIIKVKVYNIRNASARFKLASFTVSGT